jgi:methyl-accepting chemotaxis protein
VASWVSSVETSLTRSTSSRRRHRSSRAAPRAGEHGRGFAVVADEVGKLASETASQTSQIRETVTRTRSQMDEVVVATAVAREQTAKSSEDADAGREILERISGLIGSSNDTATQIATLARQQLADV